MKYREKTKMKEYKLSVQDAVEQLLMSQSTIYSWIDKGFLKTEETPAGRFIVISENELQQIRSRNLKSKRNKVSKQLTSQNVSENASNVVDAEVLNNGDELLRNINNAGGSDIIKLISDLASKAGKYELLEDIQKQKQQDVDYWRNEYFKINSEKNSLEVEKAQLIRENSDLKKKNEELDALVKKLKKPFGRFFA